MRITAEQIETLEDIRSYIQFGLAHYDMYLNERRAAEFNNLKHYVATLDAVIDELCRIKEQAA